MSKIHPLKQLVPLFAGLCCLLVSCATMFNGRNQLVQVTTAHPCYLVNNAAYYSVDTGNGWQIYDPGQLLALKPDHPILLTVAREREPLALRLQNDTMKTTLWVDSKKSWVWYLNFGSIFFYGAGFIADAGTDKKFAYPNDIFVDIAHPAYNTFQHATLDPKHPGGGRSSSNTSQVIFSKDAR